MKKAIVVISLVSLLLVPLVATAATTGSFGWEWTSDIGLGSRDIRASAISIVNVVLGFLGIIAVIIILYGGFKWMTASGNEENVSTARQIIIAGIIGLVIILAAYAIARFVIEQLYAATD